MSTKATPESPSGTKYGWRCRKHLCCRTSLENQSISNDFSAHFPPIFFSACCEKVAWAVHALRESHRKNWVPCLKLEDLALQNKVQKLQTRRRCWSPVQTSRVEKSSLPAANPKSYDGLQVSARAGPAYNLRDENKLNVPLPRKNGFSYSGAILWNILPCNLKEAESLEQFKRLLKGELCTAFVESSSELLI